MKKNGVDHGDGDTVTTATTRRTRDVVRSERNSDFNCQPILPLPKQAHAMQFQSRFHRKILYNWPIHDILLSKILVWVAPTHRTSYILKFIWLTGMIVVGISAAIVTMISSSEASVAISSFNGWMISFVVTVLFYHCYYYYSHYRRILTEVIYHQYAYMDPTAPHIHRLPSHTSSIRYYTSEVSARHGACCTYLIHNNTSIENTTDDDTVTTSNKNMKDTSTTTKNDILPTAPNVWNINTLQWEFALFTTPQNALRTIAAGATNATSSDTQQEGVLHIFQPVTVPSLWTMDDTVTADNPIYTNIQYPFYQKGYLPPPLVPEYNPTGIYRVELPYINDDTDSSSGNIVDATNSIIDIDDVTSSSSVSSQYTILLHGIESACYVYMNDIFVGFTKDSRLPAEFDITSALIESVRQQQQAKEKLVFVLQLVVVRWSDGSYVEDQDHWSMAGIHRSIEIIKRPNASSIIDYIVQADANGHLSCVVSLDSPSACKSNAFNTTKLIARLYNDQQLNAIGTDWKQGECIWTSSHELSSSGQCPDDYNNATITISDMIENVKTWTAETPNLYTLTLSLVHTTNVDSVLQCESCRVGFRTVNIASCCNSSNSNDNEVQINGKRITICGMNRHEHDPDTGKVISVEQMCKDICVLKQNNFNCIRTSHYPNDVCFYKLCDYYGIYVWDEANIETHGMVPMGRISHDYGWENTYVSRFVLHFNCTHLFLSLSCFLMYRSIFS